MSAQLWQRLSISHHRNVPGSTFHLTTFATCFKLPKTRYRQLNSIVLYVSVFTVSLMDQHTILLSWFSCAPCMYYHWFRIESASPLPLIWSTYSLLWWYYPVIMIMLMSASACLRFGGLKSFLPFPVSFTAWVTISHYRLLWELSLCSVFDLSEGYLFKGLTDKLNNQNFFGYFVLV